MAIRKLKSLYYSIWLGWQIDSNWTDPFVFIVFTLIKPLATALTFFLMYYIIIGDFSNPFFGYIFVGSTFNAYLSLVLYNSIWMVHADRETYQTLKYIYITDTPLWLYYAGRLIVKFIAATISTVIILLVGILIAQVPVRIDYPLLVLSVTIGVLLIITLGYIFAFMAMMMAHYSQGIATSLTSLFFLLSGTVFPIDVLPEPIRLVSLAMPSTYWFALLRRSILGYDIGYFSRMSVQSIGCYLLLTLTVLIIIALTMYKLIDHLVRKKGIIDMNTNF